jgi:hypothetical protein
LGDSSLKALQNAVLLAFIQRRSTPFLVALARFE